MTDRDVDAVVIVGAGAAGLTALEVLRSEGFTGKLTLIGAEEHLPYDRPPLSKQVLNGTMDVDDLWLRPPGTFDELGADVVVADAAVQLDRRRSEVVTSSGLTYAYDRLVIATGVEPRTLGGQDPQRRVLRLKTIDDAAALRLRLVPGAKLLVVGAGFLGVEVAMSAMGLGCDVVIVDPEPIPMSRQLGAFVGDRIRARHEAAGVAFRLGVGVAQVDDTDDDRSIVRLTDGTMIEADVVLAAIGSEPAHEWLVSTDLVHPSGIPVDRQCRATAEIFVAGDVAAQPAAVGTLGMRRHEHRLNASEQGRCVAQNILGAGLEHVPSDYFWSDQADLRLKAVGAFPAGGLTTVVSGDPDDDRFVAVCSVEDTIVGVLAWNDARGLSRWRSHVGARADDVLGVVR